jgi:hypothetical protein
MTALRRVIMKIANGLLVVIPNLMAASAVAAA